MNADDFDLETSAIAFDDWATFCVPELIRQSPLANKVDVSTRDGIVGSHIVEVAVKPGGLPISTWSTGEKVLWAFLASLAGYSSISLYAVRIYFHNSKLSPWIIVCIAALVGTDPTIPEDPGVHAPGPLP